MIFLFLHLCFCPFFLIIYWKQRLLPTVCRSVLHTPHRITPKGTKNSLLFLRFYPYVIHVGRMPFGAIVYRLLSSFLHLRFYPFFLRIYWKHPLLPAGCRGVLHTPHTDRVRTETKMQERIKQSIDSGAGWHTFFMRHGERDAIWRDRRLEEKSSHARLQMRISGENSNPYKSSLVALSEQLRDIFAA